MARLTKLHHQHTPTDARATVGDSHKGPLNNQGKPAYLRKKQNMNEPNNTHKINSRAHAPPDRWLDTLGRNSASLEGGDAALVKLRLARGPVAPLGEVLPRSRAGRPFERDSSSLGGRTTPRTRPCLSRELSAPSSEFLSRSRASRARCLHTCSPDRGI
jgi:hypothetical protein